MSTKSILNKTSRKKRDGMISYSNTGATGSATSGGLGAAIIQGAVGGIVLWCPTARSLGVGTNAPPLGSVAAVAQRTATTCFMRGVSERIRIQTNSHTPWYWRRICFTTKGSVPFLANNSSDTPTVGQSSFIDSSSGILRGAINQNINSMTNTVNDQQTTLFKGVSGVDWVDLITAPVDTSRVTLKYDKVKCIRSTNEAGAILDPKMWHPMNHNLVYADDENGSTETSVYNSVTSKAGMGDYIIYDIFQTGAGGTASDLLSFRPEATLYWHER